MPIFECSKCKTMENTALGHYWDRAPFKKPPLCSECANGKWHGRFPKRTAIEAGYVKQADGFYGPKRSNNA